MRPIMVLLLLSAIAGRPSLAQGDTSVPVHPPCLLTWMEGTYTCYAPFRLADAEQQMEVTPVDPVAQVTSLTGLQVRQVITLAAGTVGKPSHNPRIIGIFYVFGTCPCNVFPVPPQAQYVIVSELAVTGQRGLTVNRDQGQVTIPGSGTKTYYGPWQLTTSIPGRKLQLEVDATLSRPIVETLGQAILDAAAHDVTH